MTKRILPAILYLAFGLHLSAQQQPDRFWAQWRGPHGTGVSRSATPPLEWAEGKNIRWKIEVPGRGSATPVVWGDRLYLTTAVPTTVQGDAAHSPLGRTPVAHK